MYFNIGETEEEYGNCLQVNQFSQFSKGTTNFNFFAQPWISNPPSQIAVIYPRGNVSFESNEGIEFSVTEGIAGKSCTSKKKGCLVLKGIACQVKIMQKT